MESGSQVKTHLVSLFFSRRKSNPIRAPGGKSDQSINFSLVLPDIITNKTLEESALPGKYFFQSYEFKPFASAFCLGDLVFLLFSFAYDFFSRLCHHTGQVIYSPDPTLSFRYVL